MSNIIKVAARVATFVKVETGYLFTGFLPHDEAAARKGVVYTPMVKANLLADRAARGRGERSIDLRANETIIPAVYFAAKDIKAVTYRNGRGVETLRESHRAVAKRNRKAYAAILDIGKNAGF